MLRPIQAFLHTEVSGSVLLLVAAAVAMVWANSPWDHHYFDLLHEHFHLETPIVDIDLTLHHVINDGLMVIFFFLVGLEIKRELLLGELASVRKAVLPVGAALGGMLVPAAIYSLFNAGGDYPKGWGVPMATDIAFSVGVFAALGTRVPFSLKIFLLALAIADDLGAIMVIAVFYSESISFEALAWGAVILAGVFALQRAGIKAINAYIFVGILFWVAILQSGVHATVAGVILAFLTPHKPSVSKELFAARSQALLARIMKADAEGDHEARAVLLHEMEEVSRNAESPLDRLTHALHPWSSFLIVPIFALANAGIAVSGDALRDAASSSVALGAGLGLVVGKPLGIFVASFLLVRFGVATLPTGVRWAHILGAGMVAGIGFTVSLFVTSLAFGPADIQDQAKMGVLVASALSAILGFAWLYMQNVRDHVDTAEPQPVPSGAGGGGGGGAG